MNKIQTDSPISTVKRGNSTCCCIVFRASGGVLAAPTRALIVLLINPHILLDNTIYSKAAFLEDTFDMDQLKGTNGLLAQSLMHGISSSFLGLAKFEVSS